MNETDPFSFGRGSFPYEVLGLIKTGGGNILLHEESARG